MGKVSPRQLPTHSGRLGYTGVYYRFLLKKDAGTGLPWRGNVVESAGCHQMSGTDFNENGGSNFGAIQHVGIHLGQNGACTPPILSIPTS